MLRPYRDRMPPVAESAWVDQSAQVIGDVTIGDLSAYIAARVKDGVYDYDQLLDMSGCTLDVSSHEVLNMVRDKRIDVCGLLSKRYPFEQIIEAFHDLEAGKNLMGITVWN